MTRYEFVKQHYALLRECEEKGVAVSDWRSVDIYDEVIRLRNDGLKMEYCVIHAAEVYHVSEVRVWRILRAMKASV